MEAATAEDATPEVVLDIVSTSVPPKLMKIDGEEYKLFSFDHISPEQEAEVTALFARFQKIYTSLGSAKNDTIAGNLARKLRGYRFKLITTMTDIPRDVVEGLSVANQGLLIEAIRNEISDDEEEDAEAGDEF